MSVRLRPVLAAAVCAALAAGTGIAAAAPKPVCNLITDPAGDSTGPTQTLDVVSGDLASSAKTITAVIRVVNLAETDATSPTGTSWSIRFNAAGAELPYYILAQKPARGPAGFSFGQVSGSTLTTLGGATGIIDVAKKEVRIHVKATDLRLKPGTQITDLLAQGRRFIGDPAVGGLYLNADSSDATTSKPYAMGAASCVKPGK